MDHDNGPAYHSLASPFNKSVTLLLTKSKGLISLLPENLLTLRDSSAMFTHEICTYAGLPMWTKMTKFNHKEETMASLFDKIKKDVKKGIEEGIAVVKEGASVVSEKMGELTEEGKRQYKMFDLKAKMQSQMTVLGGRAYDVLDSKKNPGADDKVKTIFAKIKKLEEQLRKLEGGKETKAATPKKPATKVKATPKKTAQPAAKKMATKAAKKAPAKK
jgi:hypothetical protein